MAGTLIVAINPMPTGAPIIVPSCHNIFFFLLHGFFPQNVHPEGLGKYKKIKPIMLAAVTLIKGMLRKYYLK